VVLSALYLTWFNRHFALTNDLLRGSEETGFFGAIVAGLPERLGPVLAHLAWRTTFLPTHLLLPAFLVAVVLAPAPAFARGRLAFTLTLLGALLGYVAVYVGTHWELERHLDSSAHRVMFHLMPAAGLWLALFVADVLPGVRARRA